MLAQKISSFCLKMNKVAKQIKFRLQSEMMRKSVYGNILSFKLNFKINEKLNKQTKNWSQNNRANAEADEDR